MANPDFDMISVSKKLKTKAKIERLAKLMKADTDSHKVYAYQAIDRAVEEAIEARTRKDTKK